MQLQLHSEQTGDGCSQGGWCVDGPRRLQGIYTRALAAMGCISSNMFPTKLSFVIFVSYMALFINQGKVNVSRTLSATDVIIHALVVKTILIEVGQFCES